MGVVVTKQIPPLPRDTAGRWLDVICEDQDMVRRWLNVVYQMDPLYRRETPQMFGHFPGHRPGVMGASYYLWTATSEVAFRIVYVPFRAQYQAMSAGFVGNISPKEALDLVVDKGIKYMRTHGVTSVFARVPKKMANPQILVFYALVPEHPRLRVSPRFESHSLRVWNIEVPELKLS